MSELIEIVPRPACVDKVGRCAEGLCVKTLLSASEVPENYPPHSTLPVTKSAITYEPPSKMASASSSRDQSTTTIQRDGVLPTGFGSIEHGAARDNVGVHCLRSCAANQSRVSRVAMSAASSRDSRRTALESSRFTGKPETDNGRFLRHRPERSERCLNYERLYQGQGPLPKSQGVPEGPQRKNHVGRQLRYRRGLPSLYAVSRCASAVSMVSKSILAGSDCISSATSEARPTRLRSEITATTGRSAST